MNIHYNCEFKIIKYNEPNKLYTSNINNRKNRI